MQTMARLSTSTSIHPSTIRLSVPMHMHMCMCMSMCMHMCMTCKFTGCSRTFIKTDQGEFLGVRVKICLLG